MTEESPDGRSTDRTPAYLDGALLLLTLAVAVACAGQVNTTARLLLLLLAACLVPGGALLTVLPVADLLLWCSLAVALSLAIEAAGTLAMIWSGFWHPVAWALVLAALAAGALGLDLWRKLTQPVPERQT